MASEVFSGSSHLSLRGDKSGATAIEFALVAPVLLALIFSTFEGGWMVAKATMLDRAVDVVVRSIRVGASGAPSTQDQVKAAICKETLIVPACAASLTVEMTDVTTTPFPTSNAVCIDRGSSLAPVVNFGTGQRGSIMYVRACLVTDPLTPLLGLALSMPKDSKGGYYLMASSAFVNEPGN
jgi:Flp pilus assembly protein TadG